MRSRARQVSATLTELALAAGAEAMSRWEKLWMDFLVTFQDGNTASADAHDLLCGCAKASAVYSTRWLQKVADVQQEPFSRHYY